jgi:Family of unknown function (DUF6533)
MTVNYVAIAALSKLLACVHNPANRVPLGIVLLAYDTLLTLFREAEYIWLRKFKLGTVLYMLTRYPALFSVLLVIPRLLSHTSPQVCFVELHGFDFSSSH